MTLVIATGGIDHMSVGAVMAIAGATAASMTVAGHRSASGAAGLPGGGGAGGLMEWYSGRDHEDPAAFVATLIPDGCQARRRAS